MPILGLWEAHVEMGDRREVILLINCYLVLNDFNGDNIDCIRGSIADKLTSIDFQDFATVATLNLTPINTLEWIATDGTFGLDDTTAQPPEKSQKSDNGGKNSQSNNNQG